MSSHLTHRSAPQMNDPPTPISTDSDNESMSSNDGHGHQQIVQRSVSTSRTPAPPTNQSTVRLATNLIAGAAVSAATYATMQANNPDEAIFNTAIACGAGAAAYVFLPPLIARVEEWIRQGIEDAKTANELADQRHDHVGADGHVWNVLLNSPIKLGIGGLMIGGATVLPWDKIAGFIGKYAPKIANGLTKLINLRSKLDLILNSNIGISTGVGAALVTIAYGLYIAHGAGQQLKKLNKISFDEVRDNFNTALDELTDRLNEPNPSKARIEGAFHRLELRAAQAEAMLTNAIREAKYQHGKALKMQGRAKLVRNFALFAAAPAAVGAAAAGAGALGAGTGLIAAAKATIPSAVITGLFFCGAASCQYGSRQCQLVIDKCEALQKEAKDLKDLMTEKYIRAKEEMKVKLEQ